MQHKLIRSVRVSLNFFRTVVFIVDFFNPILDNLNFTSQFGFKQAHGTEMAIFALKQTVDSYRNQDTPVYMCFLDAKKAFDRVNHWTLAKKLLDRNVSLYIVKLFIFCYREQEFMV